MREAEPLYRRALALDENRLGAHHPTIAARSQRPPPPGSLREQGTLPIRGSEQADLLLEAAFRTRASSPPASISAQRGCRPNEAAKIVATAIVISY
jgi:hypothetical protein